MIRSLCLLLLLLIPSWVFSQSGQGREVLVGIESMPINVTPASNGIAKSGVKALLELPFFDDFSRCQIHPAPSLWEGKHVFINSTYGVNSPTIGVATFDVLDFNGNLHEKATTVPFSSDTLTTHPINLLYPGDTTIYLSFYFQPQGLGYEPGIKDSLVLQFYNAEKDLWEGAWAAWVDFGNKKLFQYNKLQERMSEIESDTLSTTFFRVHFPIVQEQYLTSGFRFRFRNFASVAINSDIPGLRSNSDHWNMDMVHLDRNRSYKDTLLDDIAFIKPLGSILKNYESIPWSHFNETAQQAELTNPLVCKIDYRNLGMNTWNITRLFQVYNHSTGEKYNHSGGNSNVFAFEDVSYSRYYLYNITSNWADSARFTFSSFLVTDFSSSTAHLLWNDTTRYAQNFLNYYAYDDGSAESGYGLYGEGTQNGRVAVKFNAYKSDSLVGVYMYFNRTYNNASQKYFKLAVWDDNNGKPGSIIYTQEGVRPLFTDSLNRFTLFRLDEKIWLDAGTYYVGWIQITTDMLNIGFDRNRNNRTKHFYNIDGTWRNTQFEGSLMLRPVFGKLTEPPTSIPQEVIEKLVKLYPNPASDILNIELPEGIFDATLSIFNITGQLVLNAKYDGSPVDISRLWCGTYFVRVVSNGRAIGVQKLVVARW